MCVLCIMCHLFSVKCYTKVVFENELCLSILNNVFCPFFYESGDFPVSSLFEE